MQPPASFQRLRPQIEEELRAVLQVCDPPLSTLMAYQMGWVDELGTPTSLSGGKRLRPTLSLLAAEAWEGSASQALPAAAAVELVHNFSLVHDDIQGGTPERHHRPTVWWVWGPAQAINVGDGLHALGRLALFRLQERNLPVEKVLQALTVLDQSCLKLCEGQHLDLTFQERLDIPEESYLRMVEGKAGALFGCALELGALVATDDPHGRSLLAQAGRRLGMAFQIRDDILDLWSERGENASPPGDVLNKKKSLPVIYGLSRAKGTLKRELGAIYFKRVLEPQDAARVAQLLDELGAREYAQGKAEHLCGEALQLLDETGLPPEGLRGLKETARYLVERAA